MPLQDLTPQLRTRLSRMEWAVGWFVLFATALLLFGFGYYIYNTAKNKGWFKDRAKFYIFTDTAKGLHIKDRIIFRGSPAGSITDIQPMPARGPGSEYNIYVEFEVLEPNIGYLETEGSKAKVTAADFLGNRVIEVTRGTNGYTIYIQWPVNEVNLDGLSMAGTNTLRLGEEIRNGTNVEVRAWQPVTAELVQKLKGLGKTNLWMIDRAGEPRKTVVSVWNSKEHHYEPVTKKSKPYGLDTAEDPALTDRAEQMVSQIQAALPGILALTNQISAVLVNAADLTSNLNVVAVSDIRPAVSNLNDITIQLKRDLDPLLRNANVTLTNADTNLIMLADDLGRSLNNLADITSNLNQQVQVNSNMLKQISDIVVHSDEFVQGLKRHWLFRSAFKTPNTNQPAAGAVQPFQSPKAASTGH
jgi:ABC-type transporter Mla subunit MlaD